jgi:hypothetical protein
MVAAPSRGLVGGGEDDHHDERADEDGGDGRENDVEPHAAGLPPSRVRSRADVRVRTAAR